MSQDPTEEAIPGFPVGQNSEHRFIHFPTPQEQKSDAQILVIGEFDRIPMVHEETQEAKSIIGQESQQPRRRKPWKSPRIPSWIYSYLTFYRLHLSYFIVISFLATLCFRLFPKSGQGTFSFIDCIYNAVSVTCTTGLISVRMRDFSMPHNILMMLLMILGSTIFTAILPLYFRQYHFRLVIQEARKRQSELQSEVEHPEVQNGLRKRAVSKALETEHSQSLHQTLEAMELELEAITCLNWVVSVYYTSFLVLGFLVIEILFQCSPHSRMILKQNGVHHLFFSLFQSVSSLTNAGILILDDNMVPLRQNSAILLWSSLLILVGNTMFPPCLRAIIWLLRRSSASPRRVQIFDYLLTNPRRCFTLLFPRNQTVWLVVTVMGFNAFEGIFFYVLSWKSQALDGLDTWQKIVNGVFQSVTTRSCGENVVSIGGLSPSMLVLYIAMMYIAVYPVYLSRQNSQAQDEPIELVSTEKNIKKKKKRKGDFSIATQSKRLIARDSGYLFISVFVLCIIENRRINEDPLNFSIFNIIFEVISAYGNVGLSLGYSCSLMTKLASNTNAQCTNVPYSFSGTWSVPGKLIMIVIMLMGRHRGLPDNMDSALQVPKSVFHNSVQVEEESKPHTLESEKQIPEFVIEIPIPESEMVCMNGQDHVQKQGCSQSVIQNGHVGDDHICKETKEI